MDGVAGINQSRSARHSARVNILLNRERSHHQDAYARILLLDGAAQREAVLVGQVEAEDDNMPSRWPKRLLGARSAAGLSRRHGLF